MERLFQKFPTRDSVIDSPTSQLAAELLLAAEGDSLNRGNFANYAGQWYGNDEEVVKAYLAAWSELVRSGYFVEKRDPGWYFISASGEAERQRLRRDGTPKQQSVRIIAGRWQIIKALSGGGQGITSIVRDLTGSPDERFVLKELRSTDTQARHRFATETRALTSLAHPNILRVIDFNVESEPPWYVSEYCAGHGLDKLTLHTLDLNTRLRLFLDVCSALGAAHARGITHRDIKPENVLLRSSNGPAILGDFGICWFAEAEEERLTRLNEDIGSSFCRAPELFDGPLHDVSPASDVYCLGKLLYWLVIGKGGRAGRLRAEEFERPDKNLVALLNDTRFDHVNDVLRRMLTEDLSQRYRDANEVYEACVRAFELVMNNYQPLGRPPHRCMYCGQGTYEEHAGGFSQSVELSLLHVWRVFQCGMCGHTLFFRKSTVSSTWPAGSA
jgi:serine/threonine protein kinase